MTKKLDVKHYFSTLYHSKTNGLVERFNQDLCNALAKLGDKRKNWDEFIAPTLFTYRISKYNLTKIDPFYLTYERKAKLPIDEKSKTTNIQERIEEILEVISEERNKAKLNIIKSQKK